MEILVGILVGLAWFILIFNILHSAFSVMVVDKAKGIKKPIKQDSDKDSKNKNINSKENVK